MGTGKRQYPFTAIVGQNKMKKALLLNIINPSIGGVLIRGEKGTAKSTAVRALADLLPERNEISGCKFHCDPDEISKCCDDCANLIKSGDFDIHKGKMRVIDLPVSATEDRVVGTLDIEHIIKMGKKKLEAGILAQANRNILYIDEVNLLDDHVVDILLDCAAMGVNTIEREGISYTHPARFVLVGTMNPEEGDLRPQLLDRFGLVVEVMGEKESGSRVDVIKRRLDYEDNEEEFADRYIDENNRLIERIIKSKKLLSSVKYTDEILEAVAKLSIELEVDGHRADITMIKTAVTNAAFNGRTEVIKEDLLEAAELVLPHRMRRRPFEEGILDFEKVKQIIG
ncbi:MAG: ATP-binding protein [Vallitalea sp.]|jgi:magnesium chelatase subunit I|nr:ATP-binding protein [Vallitalea sp.]